MPTTAAYGAFTGAGISFADPAGLPLGPALRDAIYDVCERAATRIDAQSVDLARRAGLDVAGWKLEYVLGRLEACAGPSALTLLDCLRIDVPNETHMLFAAALARGGLHATVNLDNGIETAYALLAGTLALPTGAPPEFEVALRRWQEWLGAMPAALHVVVTDREFEEWSRDRRSAPALFKLHGSIAPAEGETSIQPVVSDFVEMRPLTRAKLHTLRAALGAERVLVTGYSGGDADCFAPLLAELRRRPFEWADPYPSSALVATLSGFAPRQPIVAGATEVLRRDAQLATCPAWPSTDIGMRRTREALVERWRETVDPFAAAEAYGWMLIDARRHLAAERLLVRLWRASGRRSVMRHVADAVFHQGGERNKLRAARIYRWLLRPGASPAGLRTYALTRYGASYRELAQERMSARVRVVLATLLAWLVSWPDRAGPAGRTHALGDVGHFGLRFIEGRLASGADQGRLRLLVPAVRAALARGARHADAHAQVYRRLQQVELDALATLMSGRPDPLAAQQWLDAIGSIEQIYRDMSIEMGTANAAAARALAQAAAGSADQAMASLDEALMRYRVDNWIDPSGESLVARRRAVVAHIAPQTCHAGRSSSNSGADRSRSGGPTTSKP